MWNVIPLDLLERIHGRRRPVRCVVPQKGARKISSWVTVQAMHAIGIAKIIRKKSCRL